MCSHFSQDSLNKLGLRSVPLSDTSLLTCIANDFGYENTYRRPLDTLLQRDDLLVSISSSGESKNILVCAELALSKSVRLISLSGFSPKNALWNTQAHVAFHVSSTKYGIVETAHSAIIHCFLEDLYLP